MRIGPYIKKTILRHPIAIVAAVALALGVVVSGLLIEHQLAFAPLARIGF